MLSFAIFQTVKFQNHPTSLNLFSSKIFVLKLLILETHVLYVMLNQNNKVFLINSILLHVSKDFTPNRSAAISTSQLILNYTALPLVCSLCSGGFFDAVWFFGLFNCEAKNNDLIILTYTN